MTPHPVTVLVVEDDGLVRTVLARIMETEGYSVYTAVDGADALRMLATSSPVDLVVSDVSMPAMGGREFRAELAKLHPETPVLFITGHALEGRDATLPGPVLFKPFSPSALRARVRELLPQRATDMVG